jgi:hypothetical protein
MRVTHAPLHSCYLPIHIVYTYMQPLYMGCMVYMVYMCIHTSSCPYICSYLCIHAIVRVRKHLPGAPQRTWCLPQRSLISLHTSKPGTSGSTASSSSRSGRRRRCSRRYCCSSVADFRGTCLQQHGRAWEEGWCYSFEESMHT